MPRKNLLSLFADFARFAGDVAVVQRRGYRREKLTYKKLYAKALFWSHALAERGVGPGDRVFLWGPNSAEWVACFWGILLRGGVVVPMDAAAAPDFVQRAIKDAGVKLILRDRQHVDLPCAPPSMIINDFKDFAGSPQPAPDTAVEPGNGFTRSTIAEILYTSGTTAEPRGVVLTHGNFLANLEPLERGIEEYRKYERWLHPLRFVTLVPLSHVFGQFMALFVPPLLGAAVVFEPSSNPTEIIRSIKQERATALIAVPRMLDLLHAGIEREFEGQGKSQWLKRTLESAQGRKFLKRAWMFRRIHRRFGWKFWAFISGGAALSNETENFFKSMGYAVVQGYGMTETASLISLNHPFRATEGTVGKILPGREFKLSGDGEILVRGENVSSGYWEQGEFRPADQEGWLRTGDLGELDAEGNLRFRGRKKNVIVTPAGLNIHPEDLEIALRKQPGVKDCMVIPIERDGNAEAPSKCRLKSQLPLSRRKAKPTKIVRPRVCRGRWRLGALGRSLIFRVPPPESRAFPSSQPAPRKSSMDDKLARQKATERPPLHATRSTNCCNVLLEEVVEIRGSIATWNKNSISPPSTAWSC